MSFSSQKSSPKQEKIKQNYDIIPPYGKQNRHKESKYTQLKKY